MHTPVCPSPANTRASSDGRKRKTAGEGRATPTAPKKRQPPMEEKNARRQTTYEEDQRLRRDTRRRGRSLFNAGTVDLQDTKAQITPYPPPCLGFPGRVSRRPGGRNKRKTRPPTEEQAGTFPFRHSMMCGRAVASASAKGPTSTLNH